MRAIALALTAVLAAAGTVAASTLGVAPVRVELSPTARTAVLTVRNHEDSAVVVQAQPAAWSQRDEHDQLDDTRELLVTPPLFTIPPKGQQVLRIALRREPDPARELDYRLVLSEVPPALPPEVTGLRIALRITLPIFVAAQAHAAPDLTWQHSWLPDGTLDVETRNRGAAHIQILDFDAQSTAQTGPKLHSDAARYLLPGSSTHWQLRAGAAMSRTAGILIHGHSDAGDFSVTSDPGAR